jgi:hypothetical protein
MNYDRTTSTDLFGQFAINDLVTQICSDYPTSPPPYTVITNYYAGGKIFN